MSAQSLLSSVFSCSSPAAPAARSLSKRRLRQTRSLDPAIIGGGRDEGEGRGRAAGSPPGERRGARGAPPPPRGFSASTPSTPLERSPPGSGLFEPDSPRGKRSPGRELPFLARTPSANSIFSSPRRWLQQRKGQPSPPGPRPAAYVVWRSEDFRQHKAMCKEVLSLYCSSFPQGDFTWNSMSGRSVRLKSVPVQSLSELERARLQEVAFYQLQQDYDLGCQIAIPKDGQKRKKSLRKKLDSLGKEKNRDKEFIPQAFGMPLSQVIANDRAYKLKQDSQREEQKDVSDFVAFLLPFGTKRQNKELSSSNSSLSSTSETPNESTSPNTPEPAPRARRRGAMSVDSITDLDDNQSRLLEALQLSLPAEAQSKKEKARDKKLSLNPIYRQVPRLVDSCCQHLEKHGLQTVGIFRVGSSKKRVRQLREEFDRGIDVVLDEEHSIHDVAALLKEFLRDMPDPLLTRELYTPFINTLLLEPDEQLSTLQLLIYLLPPCNCDTLHRLLQFLSTVAGHAEDTTDKDGQEITGNKMTSLNLATIFGPNLLHKQKSTDKEFTVQSSARAEESTAIIAVVQKMIENYEALFMVSPDLQNEVLISLLETDPDVVDYLLRRKASQSSSPEMLRSEGSYSTGERHSSTDSNKASSGDVSPYDNNSPVLSERSLMATQEEVARSPDKLYRVPEQYTLVGHLQPKTKENSSASQAGKGSYGNIYESSLLRPGQCSLSQGNLSIYSPRWQGSSSELDSSRQVMRRSQTTAAIPECQLHPAPSRVCSNPHIEASSRSLDQSRSKSERHLTLSSVEDLTEYDLHAGCSQSTAKPSYRKERPPPPYPGPAKTSSALSQRSGVSSTLHSLWRLQRQEKSSGTRAAGGPAAKAPEQAISRQERSAPHTQVGNIYSTAAHNQNSKNVSEPDWHDWQRERWQIWELLSADNPDALPETLV
uniref:Rho GTPase activating protein 6 n=1 Tax=Anas platyrhynchos platyrhynchos TaxID=8840 RepID=A0A493TL61_ANAPP